MCHLNLKRLQTGNPVQVHGEDAGGHRASQSFWQVMALKKRGRCPVDWSFQKPRRFHHIGRASKPFGHLVSGKIHPGTGYSCVAQFRRQVKFRRVRYRPLSTGTIYYPPLRLLSVHVKPRTSEKPFYLAVFAGADNLLLGSWLIWFVPPSPMRRSME